MKPEDVGLTDSRIVLTARSGRHAFHHRLGRLGITLVDARAETALQRFLQVADTKKEVTDEDLRKIVAATAEPNGNGHEPNGHETNGHPPVTDQLHDHNHVADTLRHLIFG
jgi:isopropylmalate/homocitrate/citramalate synthase